MHVQPYDSHAYLQAFNSRSWEPAGNTTLTDPRSQRNQVGRRGRPDNNTSSQLIRYPGLPTERAPDAPVPVARGYSQQPEISQATGGVDGVMPDNNEIEIYAYATLTSMDATMWQANERKQRFIEAALSGDRSIRRLEDASSQSNQFAMAKALASGDQLLIQKAGLDAEIARLERLRAAHLDNQLSIRHTVEGSRNTIADAARKLDG